MAELLNHSHCKVCERAVRFGDETCSDECRQSFVQHKKKRARTVLFFYVTGAFLALILLMQLLPGILR